MLGWIRKHVGEWISIRAQVERAPTRFTLTITFGDLPDGWQRPPHHARTWSGLAGLILIAPFIGLLVAALLSGLGHGAAYAWISGSPAAIIVASISLFIGIPVALAMNLWRITQLGVRRHARAFEGLVALEFAPLHVLVVALALVVGGLFVAHLAADTYACWNGVRSAC
jgi:hypothetical protein